MESGFAIGAVMTYFAGTTYSNTLSLGTTIVATVLAIGTLVGVLYGAKWKSRWDQAQATIDLYAKNAAGHEDRADLAAETAKQLTSQLTAAREEIGRLGRLPDLVGLVEIAHTHDRRAQERYEASEARAHEHHTETVGALQAIVLRLSEQSTAGEVKSLGPS